MGQEIGLFFFFAVVKGPDSKYLGLCWLATTKLCQLYSESSVELYLSNGCDGVSGK